MCEKILQNEISLKQYKSLLVYKIIKLINLNIANYHKYLIHVIKLVCTPLLISLGNIRCDKNL